MVLIPVEANYLGLHGLLQMKNALESYQSHVPAVDIAGIIPCRVHPRRRVHWKIMEELEQLFPGKVTPTVRENVSLAEAPGTGRPVTLCARTSHGAHDYRNVTKWLLSSTGEVTIF
jgi:chromosome partitioning protein